MTRSVAIQGLKLYEQDVTMEIPSCCAGCEVVMAACPVTFEVGHRMGRSKEIETRTFGLTTTPAEVYAWLAQLHGLTPAQAVDWAATVNAIGGGNG